MADTRIRGILNPNTFRGRLLLAFLSLLALPLSVALALAGASARDALAIGGAVLILGIPLAFAMSWELARPVRAVTNVAVRAARGEPGTQADVTATGEVADLAEAVNILSAALRSKVTDADSVRAELRNSVRRLGETLKSTHDMSKMLAVVLETALVAVGGKSGAVYFLTARRNELLVKIGRQLDPEAAKRRLPLGEGLAGTVAETREETLVPSDGAPVPAGSEPVEPTALAVPLETESQLVGVLAIYGTIDGREFGTGDLETIASLARQAGIGVENVLLHQEAQRLSITDGLTGLWNYRQFQMILQRDIEMATRYPHRRPSLLVIDIDHFKDVNDRFGHLRGNSVLIELSQRLMSAMRNVDFLARYGGEEFVVLLPETDAEGARAIGERIRVVIEEEPFRETGQETLNVTVSIGFAVHPADGGTAQDLVQAADNAMYEAKARGRNRVVGADEIARRTDLARDPAHP